MTNLTESDYTSSSIKQWKGNNMQIAIKYQPSTHVFSECELIGDHLETEAIELASGLSVGFDPEITTAIYCNICDKVVETGML